MNKSTNVGTWPGDAERPQESGAAAPGRGGRMSRQHKTAAVLRLLRGEDLELVSRSLGVTAATLSDWRDAFLAAGEAALTTKPTTREELESDRLKARPEAALIERDLISTRRSPFWRPTALWSGGRSNQKVWPRLRYAGTQTSLRRVPRLMRENDLLAPGRVGSPRGPRNHDGTIIPDTVDTMWGTDLTTTFTGEGPASRRWNRSARACGGTLGSLTRRYVKRHGPAKGFLVYDRSPLIRRARVIRRWETLQVASDRRPGAKLRPPCQVHLTNRGSPIWSDPRPREIRPANMATKWGPRTGLIA